jgi:DNA-binding protein Fis
MKEVLKNLYKDQLITQVETYDFVNYDYFLDEDEQVFGIAKSVLGPNEKKLIGAYYEVIDEQYINNNQSSILKYLFGESKTSDEIKQIKYFLIKTFKPIERELIDDFIGLLKDSFAHEVLLTKRRNIYIILTRPEEDIDFYNLLKSIESDFMIPLMGFVSENAEVNENLPQSFQFNFNQLLTMSYSDDVLINKSSLSRHYLLKALEGIDKVFLKEYVLKGYQEDAEMLQVIKAYFESNFNTSLAAKICYMHRNTLINKIDRFTQDTNFNLRNYEDAFMVYLTILL